jgi:hypothetical protein
MQCTNVLKNKNILQKKFKLFLILMKVECILNHIISHSFTITCARCIFNERGLKFINNIGMLIPNHPNSIILITFKGGLDGWVGLMLLSQCLL